MFSMVSVFTAGSIGNLWPSYALNSFYSPSPVFKGTWSRCVLEGYVKDNKLHALCKISHSQLSLMQRKASFDIKTNKVNRS